MREETIENKIFQVRGLKRKELKQLRADKIDLNDLDATRAEEVMDIVFAIVFTPEQIAEIDEMENKYAIRLWIAVLKETFGSGEEEKNSSGSGNGSQTAKE